LLELLNTGWERCSEKSSGDHVFWLFSVPRSLLYSLPILYGKKGEVGIFLSVSLLACIWQWHLFRVTASVE